MQMKRALGRVSHANAARARACWHFPRGSRVSAPPKKKGGMDLRESRYKGPQIGRPYGASHMRPPCENPHMGGSIWESLYGGSHMGLPYETSHMISIWGPSYGAFHMGPPILGLKRLKGERVSFAFRGAAVCCQIALGEGRVNG